MEISMFQNIEGLEIIKGVKSNISDKSEIEISGIGNKIILHDYAKTGKIKIVMRGNNNTIEFGSNSSIKRGLYVVKGENQHIKIGSNTSIEKAYILAQENSNVEIGSECMLSYDITIRTTDAHGIFDEITGDRINYSKSVKIGNKVWLGAEVIILKGVRIEDGNIIGIRSLVTKNLFSNNCVFAGSPVKLIRRGVIWDKDLKNNIIDTENNNYRK